MIAAPVTFAKPAVAAVLPHTMLYVVGLPAVVKVIEALDAPAITGVMIFGVIAGTAFTVTGCVT